MSDKLQEIKDDFAWGVKAAGQGQGYTNLDDEQVSWLIEQLEQAQAANQKLVECLEWYGDEKNHILTCVKYPDDSLKLAHNDAGQRARQTLSEVKGNG